MTTDDRFKLLMHRMIARRLDASAIAVARARVDEIDDGRECRQEWRSLLGLPVDGLRRRITERSEEMTRLRLSSPLPIVFDFTDEALRRRMWRLAKKPQELAMVEIYTDLMGTDELTVVEIARMLGRSASWVEHWLRVGDLRSRMRADVEDFAEDRRKRDAALAEIGKSTDTDG